MTRILLTTISLLLTLASTNTITAKEEITKPSKSLAFIENKGQIINQSNRPRKDIDFKLDAGDITIFIGNGHLHYQWEKPVATQDTKEELHVSQVTKNKFNSLQNKKDSLTEIYRLDVKLLGVDKNVKVSAEDPDDGYENYFLPQHQEGVKAYLYKKITYKNIYPNIDWVIYTNGNDLKYDFVVHKGGDAGNIRMQYNGTSNISLNEGSVTAVTPFGSITEPLPYTYDNTTRKQVASAYKLDGNIISFETYQTDNITIDPALSWSTYYGGGNDELSNGVAATLNGDVCIVGRTGSTNNIATTGSFLTTIPSTTHQGNGFLVKFNNTGVRQWATYYDALLMDVAIDTAGNIYVTGNCSNNNMVTSGSHQSSHAGGSDAIIVKFAPNGARIWGTFYGGSYYDCGYDIEINNENEILLGGVTVSLNNIATSGSHQYYCGGSFDAFLVKFNAAGIRQWGTYYGGFEDESDILSNFVNNVNIASDNSGNIFMTGTTHSKDNIATPGSHNPKLSLGSHSNSYMYTHTDNQDAFLVKFNKNGIRQWGTYFGGTDVEVSGGVTCDNEGNVYISGYTETYYGLATTGAHKVAVNQVAAYLAKYNGNGIQQWSTYYSDYIFGYYATVCNLEFDKKRYLYFQINDMTNPKLPNTPNYDIELVKFDTKGVWQSALDFGDTSWDAGYGMSLGMLNDIYLTGNTMCKSNIATSGAHQTSFGGFKPATNLSIPAGDAYLAKYEYNDTMVYITSAFTDSVICSGNLTLTVPYQVTSSFNSGNIFTIQLSNNTGSFVSPINIGSITSVAGGNISCTLPGTITPGSGYKIRVVSSNKADTSEERNIRINTVLLPVVKLYAQPDTICTVDTAAIVAVVSNPGHNMQYSWKLNNVTISGLSNSTYFTDSLNINDIIICSVTSDVHCASNSYTIADTIQPILITPRLPNINVSSSPKDTICNKDSITLFPTSISFGGSNPTFKWYHNNSLVSSSSSDTFVSHSTSPTQQYYCIMTSNEYCISRSTDTSNTVTLGTKNTTYPGVVISAIPSGPVPISTVITFKSNFYTKGTAPQYQWRKNGVNIPGATSDTYIASYPNVQSVDNISLWVKDSTSKCVMPDSVVSSGIVVKFTNNIHDINRSNFSLFPNPNKGSFVLQGRVDSDQQIQASITDVLGRLIQRETIQPKNGQISTTIMLEHGTTLPGIYSIILLSDKNTEVLRFSITR